MNSPVTILLLDDEPLLRRATVLLLSRQGAEVVAAASADEAVALSRKRLYDVAVLDVSPPGPSPVEVARRLASEGRRPGKVIAVSASPIPDGEAEGLNLVLPRPYPFESLVQAVLGERARSRTRSGVFPSLARDEVTAQSPKGAAAAGRDRAG